MQQRGAVDLTRILGSLTRSVLAFTILTVTMPASAQDLPVIVVYPNQPYYPSYPYPYPYPHEHFASIPSNYADLPTEPYGGYAYQQSYYRSFIQPYEPYYRSYWRW